MQNKMVSVCRFYENVSKVTGKRYFSANFTFGTKLLLFKDDSAEGENIWQMFITEKESKPPQAGNFGGTPGDDSQTRRRTAA